MSDQRDDADRGAVDRGSTGARESNSVPRSSFRRGARLASLPLGFAGRATVGLGRRLGGTPAEQVSVDLQQRAAEQLFRVLGELKGGAMKFGQALSLFESMLPEEVAAPYRAQLSRLQDAAPPMPTSRVHAVLTRELGADWRKSFTELRCLPGGGRLDRSGPPGDLARRAYGRGEGAVPGCRRRAAIRPETDRPVVEGRRAAGRRCRRQRAGRGTDRAGQRGARLHPGGRLPAAGRRGLRRQCGVLRPARAGEHDEGDGQ